MRFFRLKDITGAVMYPFTSLLIMRGLKTLKLCIARHCENGMKIGNSAKLITVAVSLGDAESLIEHAASMTHSTYTPEELEASGIPAGLIILSAGPENAEDIVADLKQALDQI